MEAYNYYLIIGGMPECVVAWMESKDPRQVSQIQEELITVYENDFSKHNGKINSGRILMVFRSIVTQLAKENEKFIYGVVKEGARAREFEEAVEPRYYSTSWEEIDFIVQHGMEIVPIEVKAGTDKSAASFKNYIKKRNPTHAVRLSKREYRKDGAITNIPLYLAGKLPVFLD